MALALTAVFAAVPAGAARANDRLVVPLSKPANNVSSFHALQAALTTPGLAPGDAIEIRRGAFPGSINDAALDTAQVDAGGPLTIRGTDDDPANTPAFAVPSNLTVGAPGLRLIDAQVHLVGGNLSYLSGATGARIKNSLILSDAPISAADGVVELASTGATISRSSIVSNAGAIASDVIQVSPMTGAGNVIRGNRLASVGPSTQNLLAYLGAATSTGDLVQGNAFFGGTGVASLLLVGNGVGALTIDGNRFQDDDNSQAAIDLASSAHAIKIKNNSVNLRGTTTTAIALQGGGAATATSANITVNRLSTAGNGAGLRIDPGSGGSLDVAVARNRFGSNAIGVRILAGGGGSVVGIDLGGGALSSRGENDFRKFSAAATPTSGAIVVSASPASGPVQAKRNLFSVPPELAIFDQDDDAARADVLP